MTHKGLRSVLRRPRMRIDLDTKKMIPGTGYGESVSPVDGTVWYTSPVAGGPGNKLYMIDPKTEKFKDYPLPAPGRFPHGIDFSSDGNVWTSLGSGQLGRLDVKTGEWKFWDNPGLKFKGTGAETGTTDFPYYVWVDQFNASGLGKDTVFVTGTTSDASSYLIRRRKSSVCSMSLTRCRIMLVVWMVELTIPMRVGRAEALDDLQLLPSQIHGKAQRLRESHANPPQSIGELMDG